MNVKKVRELLEAKNATQKDFAAAVGVSEAFVSYMMDGYKVPSVGVLKKMAEYFGVLVDELL